MLSDVPKDSFLVFRGKVGKGFLIARTMVTIIPEDRLQNGLSNDEAVVLATGEDPMEVSIIVCLGNPAQNFEVGL